jgi:hypothetical protein
MSPAGLAARSLRSTADTSRAWRLPLACVFFSYAILIAASLRLGQLILDEATTYLVAVRPWRALLTLPTTFQSQPPVFYLLLHAWLRVADGEAWLRLLPAICMAAGALVIAAARWLPPGARFVAIAMLLLSPFSRELATFVRPYALSETLAAASMLLCYRLLTPAADRRTAIAYVLVTVLMLYTLAMAMWVFTAEAAILGVVLIATAARAAVSAAIAKFRVGIVSVIIVGILFLPYAVLAWITQGSIGHPTLGASLRAALNPRYYVSGPLLYLTLPWHATVLPVAFAAIAVADALWRRDHFVAFLIAFVIVQIACTHGFLEGRSGFAFRYLAPAMPALYLIVGLGAARLADAVRRSSRIAAVIGLVLLSCAAVAAARTWNQPHIGVWRDVAADLRRLPGPKMVFFDVGWEAAPFAYEVRHDADVHLMTDPGTGWATAGQAMSSAYVTRAIDAGAGAMRMFFYQFNPTGHRSTFDETFAPAMARLACRRTYERRVPADSATNNGLGAALYGYGCHAR